MDEKIDENWKLSHSMNVFPTAHWLSIEERLRDSNPHLQMSSGHKRSKGSFLHQLFCLKPCHIHAYCIQYCDGQLCKCCADLGQKTRCANFAQIYIVYYRPWCWFRLRWITCHCVVVNFLLVFEITCIWDTVNMIGLKILGCWIFAQNNCKNSTILFNFGKITSQQKSKSG